MHSWLRNISAQNHQRAMRSRLAQQRNEDEFNNNSSSNEAELDEMPPLLEPEDNDASLLSSTASPSTSLTFSSSSSSSSSSGQVPKRMHPAPARFAFQPRRALCVPDYSCCLRYGMKLATCCMPRKEDFHFVPSFGWLQSRFYQLHADTATLAFLHNCDRNFYENGWCSWWGMRVGFLKPCLRRCMAHTDVNGLLGCGLMFLASGEQIRILLQQSIPEQIRGLKGVEWPWTDLSAPDRRSRLLDVGAGDGHITSQVSKFFDETTATEVAPQMIKRLKARGFTTIHTGDLDQGLSVDSPLVGDGFDLITMFNVLDRCSKPRTLLQQLRARLRKPRVDAKTGKRVNTSRVILSVPLPLDPSVEVGTRWLNPEERILNNSRSARDFESALCQLAEMLLSVGFDIESVSRIPYLSQGDTFRPFYVLDASLWVLSSREDGVDPLPSMDAEEVKARAAGTFAHAHGPSSVPPPKSSMLDVE